jgi:hypothetical protein
MRKILIMVLAFGLLAVACSDSQEDAEAALCDNLADLGSAIQSAASLDPATATVDDVNNAADAIQSAWSDVESSAEDVDNIRLDNTESAFNDFESTVSGISGDSSIPDALTQVSQAAGTLQSQVDSINSELDCSSS